MFELRLEVCPETFSSSSKITDEAFFDALIRFYIDSCMYLAHNRDVGVMLDHILADVGVRNQ